LGLSEPSWPDTPEIEFSAAAEQQIRPPPLEPVLPPAEPGVEHADDPKRVSDGVVAEQAAATPRPGVPPTAAKPIAAPVETRRAAMGEELGRERHPGRRWAAAQGAFGGAILPFLVLILRVSEEGAAQLGLDSFDRWATVSGFCVLLPAIFGALLGLAGGRIGERICQQTRWGNSLRGRLVCTLAGGVVGGLIALLMGLCPAMLLAFPG
jgi:hypothetical protein